MVGPALATNYGAKLKSPMLCGPSPGAPPDAKETWAPRIAAVTKAGSLVPLADGTMERWFTDAFKSCIPCRWRQIRDTILGTTARGFLGCGAAIQNFDFVPRLPTLKIPTLVVCGADDQGTPPSANKRIAALVPGARYEEIEKARHLPNVEQPAAFNLVIMRFVVDHRTRGFRLGEARAKRRDLGQKRVSPLTRSGNRRRCCVFARELGEADAKLIDDEVAAVLIGFELRRHGDAVLLQCFDLLGARRALGIEPRLELVRAYDLHGRRRRRSRRLLLGCLGARFDLATLLIPRVEQTPRPFALVGECRLESPALG